MARSLNSVQLIGNLTRDPELRYTPTGTAVCTLSIATNRSWTTDKGEKKEEADYHRVIAWGKLAEICSQLLFKGSKVYVHGRLSTRSYTGSDNQQKYITEVVIDDMMVLSGKKEGAEDYQPVQKAQNSDVKTEADVTPADVPEADYSQDEKISPDDIPF